MYDRQKFFDAFKSAFDPHLEQGQVDGLNFLLSNFESDPAWADVREVAYALATIYHETATTFQPIEEFGKGKGHPYGKPDPDTHQAYYGRGYVQLTWKKNYEAFADLLHEDLINNPDLAMEPETAFHILSIGMRSGLFTGKKLRDYIHGKECDYREARKIINGLDKASTIAMYARQFEKILSSAAAPSASPSSSTVSPQIADETADTSNSPTDSPPPIQIQQTQVSAEAPKGDPANKDGQQVSQNGSLARWLTGGGIGGTIVTGVIGWGTGHLDAVGIIAICATALILALIFRGTIIDAIRMQSHADPDKFNVK